MVTNQLDAKDRVTVPPSFRVFLRTPDGEQVVLTNHLYDACILAYPVDEHRRIVKRLSEFGVYDENAIRLRRLLVSGAFQCQLDKQGRILVPKPLVTYAGLSGAVMLNGVGNNFEIWSPEKWDKRHGDDVQWVRSNRHEGRMQEYKL